MTDLLCSTGVFACGEAPDDVDFVIAGMQALSGTAFEVIFEPSWYDDPLAALYLAAAGQRAPVLHLDKTLGAGLTSGAPLALDQALARFGANCKLARAIGAELLVMHLWGLPDSDRKLQTNLDALPHFSDLAEQYGLVLSIETLPCAERTPVDVALLCLQTEPRVGITLDTGFLALQGQLHTAIEDDRLWTTGRGVNHVHLKDLADAGADWVPGGYLRPGQGSLDLDGFLDGLTARGYPGAITLEAVAQRPDHSPDATQITQSLDWIRARLG